jgi:hypothetical protein
MVARMVVVVVVVGDGSLMVVFDGVLVVKCGIGDCMIEM